MHRNKRAERRELPVDTEVKGALCGFRDSLHVIPEYICNLDWKSKPPQIKITDPDPCSSQLVVTHLL